MRTHTHHRPPHHGCALHVVPHHTSRHHQACFSHSPAVPLPHRLRWVTVCCGTLGSCGPTGLHVAAADQVNHEPFDSVSSHRVWMACCASLQLFIPSAPSLPACVRAQPLHRAHTHFVFITATHHSWPCMALSHSSPHLNSWAHPSKTARQT